MREEIIVRNMDVIDLIFLKSFNRFLIKDL